MNAVVGPRKIGDSKRITLPPSFQEKWVTVLPEARGRALVVVRESEPCRADWTTHDKDRPRLVSKVGQVTIPAETLAEVGWKPRDRVYLWVAASEVRLVAERDIEDLWVELAKQRRAAGTHAHGRSG